MEIGRFQNLMLSLILILVSAMLWIGFGLAGQKTFYWANYTPGIDLVYIPAGVRLLIVMVFGIWGATGIAISNPFMALFVFSAFGQPSTIINSIIAGFVPYTTVASCSKLLGIDHDLVSLRPTHLLVLALAVSVTTPIAFNLQFIFEGLQDRQEFGRNLSAMIFGDFVGCFVVLMLARLMIALYRVGMISLKA